MPADFTSVQRRQLLAVAMVLIFIFTVIALRSLGRLWLCSCGEVYLWAGDINSAHNSQHFFDPYSLTHLLHGLGFFWILTAVAGRLSGEFRVGLAVLMESVWETVENTSFVINRYREATIALGYTGDTVLNSVSDIAVCTGGFLLATYYGLAAVHHPVRGHRDRPGFLDPGRAVAEYGDPDSSLRSDQILADGALTRFESMACRDRRKRPILPLWHINTPTLFKRVRRDASSVSCETGA